MSHDLARCLIDLDSSFAVTQAVIVAKQLELSNFLMWVKEHNPSKDLPYHSNMHQILVAVMAHRLYTMSPHILTDDDESETLPALFLAGLFHDYNHSGGTEPDSSNIQRALEGLAAAVDELSPKYPDLGQTVSPISNRLYEKTKAFIQATEWPWKPFPLDNSTRGFEYLRDADIMASAMVAGLAAPILGLPQELKHKFNGYVMTPKEMAIGQSEFLSGVKMNTQEGAVLWANVWPTIQAAQQTLAESM